MNALYLALFVLLVSIHPAVSHTVAFYGSSDPIFTAKVTSILNLVADLDMSPISSVMLPLDEVSAAASVVTIADLFAVVIQGDIDSLTTLAQAIEGMPQDVIIFSDDPIPPLSPSVVFGGPSIVDQLLAHINTRIRLPPLDIADVVIVMDDGFASLVPVVESVANETSRRVTIVMMDAATPASEAAEVVFDAIDIENVEAMFFLAFPVSRAAHADILLRAIYDPDRLSTFLIPDGLLAYFAASLTADPLPPSEVFSVAIESFTALNPTHPQLALHLEPLVGPGPIDRQLSFIHMVAAVLSVGIAQLAHYYSAPPPLATFISDLRSAIKNEGYLTLGLSLNQTIGPIGCPIHHDPFNPNPFSPAPCSTCNQMVRTAHRVVIGTDGSVSGTPYASQEQLFKSICKWEVKDIADMFIFFSIFNTNDLLEIPDETIRQINLDRQIGAYIGVKRSNRIEGLNDQTIEPRSLMHFNASDPDSLERLYVQSNGSFIFNMLFNNPETVLSILANMEILNATKGINQMIWGLDSMVDELFFMPNATNPLTRNPRVFIANPLVLNIIAVVAKFGREQGLSHIVFYTQYWPQIPSTWANIQAGYKKTCSQFGFDGDVVIIVQQGVEDPENDQEIVDDAVVQVNAALNELGVRRDDRFLLFYDGFIATRSGHLLCTFLSNYTSADIIAWDVEPSIANDTTCPTWPERSFIITRWPHYTTPGDPLAAAYLEDMVGVDADLSFRGFNKWVGTRLLTTVLEVTIDQTPEITFETLASVLYGGQTFFVDGQLFGPFNAQPDDPTVLSDGVCNSMVKQYFVFQLGGNSAKPSFITTSEFGLDPLLDYGPYCNFFIPVPIVTSTSLVALWISLGSVGIVLGVSCCCCYLFCWLLLLLGLMFKRQRKESRTYRVLKNMAETASRQKSLFVSNMSHELRTPLNAIIGTIDLVKDTPMSDDQRRFMDVIGSSSELLLDVVNDVLFAAQLAAGQIDDCPREFQLYQVIESVLRAACNSSSKQIDYYAYYLPGTPLTVHIDRRRLSQILMNIVGNATKFTSEGSIRLVVGPIAAFDTAYKAVVLGEGALDAVEGMDVSPSDNTEGCELQFQVDDSGIGLDPTEYEKVFGRFTRLTAGAHTDFTGTGLGLHIAKKLVEAVLHGTITACSSDDMVGARFTFTGIMPPTPQVNPLIEEVGDVVLLDDTPNLAHARALASMLRMIGLPSDSIHLGSLESPPPANPSHVIACHPVTHAEPYLAIARDVYGLARVTVTSNTLTQCPTGVQVLVAPFSVDEVTQVLASAKTTANDATPVMVADDVCRKVLVAEDDAINCHMLNAFFKRVGVEPSLYSDALKLIEDLTPESSPSLAVLDYHMPGMTGDECARELRRRYGTDITIVLITADVTITCDGDLFDAVMYKPVRFKAFTKVLGSIGMEGAGIGAGD